MKMEKALLEGYDGKGKDKVTVADELIDRAIEMGFLSEGGQVSFSIDSPDDALFQEYGTELRTKVTEHLDGRITITIEIVEPPRRTGTGRPGEQFIPGPPLQSTSQPASTSPSSSEPSRPGLRLRRLPTPLIMTTRITVLNRRSASTEHMIPTPSPPVRRTCGYGLWSRQRRGHGLYGREYRL